jgi:putative Mg2+ transporter-C (MgtC) family protein
MLTFHETFIRLLFAGALGAAIGVEREIRRRPAGIRTSMFVCMATALFTVLSAELAHRWGDSSGTRIASNIVQGIGFLGAGAILRDNAGVIGMTTAATIFVEAAIGMAVGGGLYAVAGAATVIVLFALVVLSWVTDWFGLKGRAVVFRMTTSHADNVAAEVQRYLAVQKINMQHFRVSMVGTKSIVEFEADVSHHQQELMVEQFKREDVITEVVPVESRHA